MEEILRLTNKIKSNKNLIAELESMDFTSDDQGTYTEIMAGTSGKRTGL